MSALDSRVAIEIMGWEPAFTECGETIWKTHGPVVYCNWFHPSKNAANDYEVLQHIRDTWTPELLKRFEAELSTVLEGSYSRYKPGDYARAALNVGFDGQITAKLDQKDYPGDPSNADEWARWTCENLQKAGIPISFNGTFKLAHGHLRRITDTMTYIWTIQAPEFSRTPTGEQKQVANFTCACGKEQPIPKDAYFYWDFDFPHTCPYCKMKYQIFRGNARPADQ